MKAFLHLFKLDINDHNTLLGGWMGFAHAAQMAIALAVVYYGSLALWAYGGWLTPGRLATFAGIAMSYYFLKRETLGFKVWGWRSLDSFMDLLLPALVFVGFLYARCCLRILL